MTQVCFSCVICDSCLHYTVTIQSIKHSQCVTNCGKMVNTAQIYDIRPKFLSPSPPKLLEIIYQICIQMINSRDCPQKCLVWWRYCARLLHVSCLVLFYRLFLFPYLHLLASFVSHLCGSASRQTQYWFSP